MTTLRFAANQGTDADGQQQWGPDRAATRSEGTRFGVICVAIGLGLVVLGICAGPMGRAVFSR